MIWTRDAEDSLTYVKSNKKVRMNVFAGLFGVVASRFDSRSGGLRLIVFDCVDAEFFIHSSEKGALIILVCVIILSLAKKVAVVN